MGVEAEGEGEERFACRVVTIDDDEGLDFLLFVMVFDTVYLI